MMMHTINSPSKPLDQNREDVQFAQVDSRRCSQLCNYEHLRDSSSNLISIFNNLAEDAHNEHLGRSRRCSKLFSWCVSGNLFCFFFKHQYSCAIRLIGNVIACGMPNLKDIKCNRTESRYENYVTSPGQMVERNHLFGGAAIGFIHHFASYHESIPPPVTNINWFMSSTKAGPCAWVRLGGRRDRDISICTKFLESVL